jgi:hypothetical protein
LWLTADDLAEATGWHLKAEGLCRDEICIPLNDELKRDCVADGAVNAASMWKALGRPVLRDEAATTWMLGEAAEESNQLLRSAEAPDFTLPDITGKLHSLSDYRGKKVFLSTWASW